MSRTLPACSACFYDIPSTSVLFLHSLGTPRTVLYISISWAKPNALSFHELASYRTCTVGRFSVSRPRLLLYLVFYSINGLFKLSLLGVNTDDSRHRVKMAKDIY